MKTLFGLNGFCKVLTTTNCRRFVGSSTTALTLVVYFRTKLSHAISYRVTWQPCKRKEERKKSNKVFYTHARTRNHMKWAKVTSLCVITQWRLQRFQEVVAVKVSCLSGQQIRRAGDVTNTRQLWTLPLLSTMINTYQTSLAPPPVPPRLNRSHPVLIPAGLPSPGHSKPLLRFLLGIVVLHLVLSAGGFVYLYHINMVKQMSQIQQYFCFVLFCFFYKVFSTVDLFKKHILHLNSSPWIIIQNIWQPKMTIVNYITYRRPKFYLV